MEDSKQEENIDDFAGLLTIYARCQTDDLADLFTALAKAQGSMKEARQSSKNPFFKSNYADLSAVVEASRPSLASNGLSIIHYVRTYGGKRFLFTRLGHSSGQYMDSWIPIEPPKEDPQSLGSYFTYLKRYTYSGISGVVAAGDDDDGEKAMYRKTPTVSRLSDAH